MAWAALASALAVGGVTFGATTAAEANHDEVDAAAIEAEVQELSIRLGLDGRQVELLREVLYEAAVEPGDYAGEPVDVSAYWETQAPIRARIEAALSARQRLEFAQYREECRHRRFEGAASNYPQPYGWGAAPVYVAPAPPVYVAPAPPVYVTSPRRVVRPRYVAPPAYVNRPRFVAPRGHVRGVVTGRFHIGARRFHDGHVRRGLPAHGVVRARVF